MNSLAPTTSSYVLLVEDDADVRGAVAELLEEEGFLVRTAADGHAGLRALRAHGAAGVIVLDMMMPGMDGASFRRIQLADPSLAHLPVIVMTASVDDVSPLGAAAVLRKPFRTEVLLGLVSRWVPRARAPATSSNPVRVRRSGR